MRPLRFVTEPERQIPGWTVYETSEGWSATSEADGSLTVQHHDWRMLADACAAIDVPHGRRNGRVLGPGGGINV